VKGSRGLIAVVVALGVVFLSGCTSANNHPAALPSLMTRASASPSATPAAIPSEAPAQEGPRPSSYPAGDVKDFAQVCDNDVYFPQSPMRSSRAPHPVVLIAGAVGNRYQRIDYSSLLGSSTTVQQTWAPVSTKKVQMVACLDYESLGSQIRTCKYGQSAEVAVALLRATYRLHVYEVATGRKLLDKMIVGDDPKCPAYLPGFTTMHADPTARKLVEALRNLVTK